MKKTTVIAMALVLCITPALSATAQEVNEKSSSKTVTEASSEATEEAAATEKGGFLSWVGQGADVLSKTISAGWDSASSAVEAGWDAASGAIVEGWDAASGAIAEGWDAASGAIAEGWDAASGAIAEGWDAASGVIAEGWDAASGAIAEGWDVASGAVVDGWNKTVDVVGSGWDIVVEKVTDWASQAEAYMKEKQWDKQVQEAWNTLKQGAEQKGKIAKEKLSAAYETVKEWVLGTGENVDQRIAEAIDQVAGAAGVAEAQRACWYRSMEAYMTEKADLVTESAREAWTVIRQDAAEAGSVSEEKVKEAYAAIREWMGTLGEEADPELIQILEEISGQQDAGTLEEISGRQDAGALEEISGRQDAGTQEEISGQQNTGTR